MRRIGRNLRIAARRLRRAPSFSAISVGTIALGVGATVAVFSVIHAVLLAPLPYEEPEELLALFEWHLTRDSRTNVGNPRNFRRMREGLEQFEAVSAVTLQFPGGIESRGETTEARVQYAQPGYFRVLGVEPVVGRTFASETPDGAHELVLSHGYWTRRFGADPAVVGSTVRVNGVSTVVTGVLPPVYLPFADGTDAWRTMDIASGDEGRFIYVVGRTAEGASREAAAEEARALFARLKEEFPETNAAWDLNPLPLKAFLIGDVQRGLWLLLGAVGLLLLIGCANVANLFLVAATDRQREMAVRTSLGATGRTLAGQLLTESLIVAGLGALVGVALAHVGTTVLTTRMPDAFSIPRVEGAAVEGTALLFALGLTIVTGVLFGIVPAIQAARTPPSATLAAEGRSTSRSTAVVRAGLVVTQVALSVTLLAGAALMGRSVGALLDVDPGIEPMGVWTTRVNLEGSDLRGGNQQTRFFQAYLERITSLPGVASAGAISFLPMDGLASATSVYPTDQPVPDAGEMSGAEIRNVVGDYFGTLGIALLRGRLLDGRDREDAPQTVVVSEALAEQFWPGESAVGRSLVVDWVDDTPWEVVGVVENVTVHGPDAGPAAVAYLSYAQAEFFPWLHVVVRTQGPVPGLPAALQKELREMDASVPFGAVRAMPDVVARTTARPRMTSLLVALFAGVATLLASVGLYGVLSFSVSRRVREIGVRIALGARPGDVSTMVARRALGLVVAGLAIGLLLALAAGQLARTLLFGIEPTDPLSLAGAAGTLLAVALLASLVPAVRAARVPPAEALRTD